MNMLRTYKDVYKHLKMRQRDCIPWDDRFPPHMWGEYLGKVVCDIRSGRIHEDKRKELIELGFDFSKQVNPNVLGWDVLEKSLVQYKATRLPNITEGGLWTIPRKFMVPFDEPGWPEEARGKGLGSIVCDIRNNGCHHVKRKELEAMGLDFSKQQNGAGHNALGWDVVEQCIRQYKAANPKTTKEKGWTVPLDFYVPSGDAAWPEEAWGKGLGMIVKSIRINCTYKDHRAAVEALGIVIYNK